MALGRRLLYGSPTMLEPIASRWRHQCDRLQDCLLREEGGLWEQLFIEARLGLHVRRLRALGRDAGVAPGALPPPRGDYVRPMRPKVASRQAWTHALRDWLYVARVTQEPGAAALVGGAVGALPRRAATPAWRAL